MIFHSTALQGAYIIKPEPRNDERGFFARSFCAREFAGHGLNSQMVNTNLSFNTQCGTLRGLHFQHPPHAEAKLVRCTRGAIYDVIIDLRPDSPTYTHWLGIELTADNYLQLYVPEGFAHGFQTLEDATDVTYQVSAFYTPGAEGGVRYDDPQFAIHWPLAVSVVSAKDASWPAFEIAA